MSKEKAEVAPEAKAPEVIPPPPPADEFAPKGEAVRVGSKNNSEFRKIIEIATVAELVASRKPGLRQMQVLLGKPIDIYDNRGHYKFLRGRFDHNSSNPASQCVYENAITAATIYTVQQIIDTRNHLSSDWLVLLLHPLALQQEPKQRKFKAELTLNWTLMELARVAPMNPTLRSHITAIFKKPPPQTADTYQKLVDWMEFEFEAPILPSNQRIQYGYTEPSTPKGPLLAARREAPRVAFEIAVTVIGKEIGNAPYSIAWERKVRSVINERHVVSLVEDGRTFSEIVDALDDEISPNDGTDDRTYKQPEIDMESKVVDSDTITETKTDREAITASLTDWLRRKYGAQEATTIINSRR